MLLTEELGLVTGNEPTTKMAMWLSTQNGLTELVDINGFQRLPGTYVSSRFDAYTVADPNCQLPIAVSIEWVRQMCDDALHLDGYEPTLLTLSTS